MQVQQIEEQIWNYIDGSANQQELLFVERMIATDLLWRNKYKELLVVNQLLKTELELEQPSMRFNKNIMEQISGLQPAKATVKYINKNIIRSIAAFFVLTIAGLLIYSFTQVTWSSASTSTSLPFNLPKLNIDQLHMSKLLNSTTLNVILMVNVVLGLMLLDSYLRKKKKSTMQH